MPNTPLNEVVQFARRAAVPATAAVPTDGQLLEDFLARRDEAAVAALVRRHGPMVWGVCRRILGDRHDAEDAFQATFLVLIRRAAAVVPRELVGNWLYGVASLTARKARQLAARRRAHERQVADMPEPAAAETNRERDWHEVLDEELARLPDKYRAAVVLCDLQGKTRKEASRQLQIPEGTVATRLARARQLLGRRLANHGLAVGGGAIAAALADSAAAAVLPVAVATAATRVVARTAAGEAAAASARVVALTDAVVKSLLLARLKPAATLVLLLALVLGVAGVGAAVPQDAPAATTAARTAGQPLPQPAPQLPAADAERTPPVAESPPVRPPDPDELRGAWQAVRVVVRGIAIDFEDGRGLVYTFKGDTLAIATPALDDRGKGYPFGGGWGMGGFGMGSWGMNGWNGGPWGVSDSSAARRKPGGPGAPPWGKGGSDPLGEISRLAHGAPFPLPRSECAVRLDPTATPKTIDRALAGKGPVRPAVIHGVYALDGDVLRIWEAPAGADRPTASELERGAHCTLWVLQRGKG